MGRGALELVRRLRGVSWRWTQDVDRHRGGQADMGVIAQEVEEVFPELVTTDERGMKRVNYVGLIAPMIEAIKELDDRLTALESGSDRDLP